MLRRLQARLRPRLTDEELAVARAFLNGSGDPRYALLTNQVTDPQNVARSNPTPDSCEVYIGETKTEFLIDLPGDKEVISDWVRVRDETSGQALEFSVEIDGSGIFRTLRGRSSGSKWPRKWRVSDSDLEKIRPIVLPRFPQAIECLDALRSKLGLRHVADDVNLLCSSAASPEEIRDLERREGARLPPKYRDLLSIANGLILNGVDLYGTRDLSVVEFEGARWWLISTIGAESFVLIAADVVDGQPIYLWPHDARSRDEARELAADFATFLEDSLISGSFVAP